MSVAATRRPQPENNLGCPTAREVGDSEEPPQGDEGTVRQLVGRLERGGRPGETESTTKPSGLERPLGFVRLCVAVVSRVGRVGCVTHPPRDCQSPQSAKAVHAASQQLMSAKPMLPTRLNVWIAPPDMVR